MNDDIVLTTTVVIPAHDEEAVILRTLSTLLKDAHPGEFEIIVICNGCRDKTAELAQAYSDKTIVLELDQPSKADALNAGIALASGTVVLLLDADIDLTTDDARKLACAAQRPDIDAAIGHMKIETTGAAWGVRAFYRIWLEHPYLINGKFAAAIALSKKALHKIGPLPSLIADDTYLRRVISTHRVAIVPQVKFLVRVPRTLLALIRTRARSYDGTRQLNEYLPVDFNKRTIELRGLIRRLAERPWLWPYVPIYLAIVLTARALALVVGVSDWERDLTTRTSSYRNN